MTLEEHIFLRDAVAGAVKKYLAAKSTPISKIVADEVLELIENMGLVIVPAEAQ